MADTINSDAKTIGYQINCLENKEISLSAGSLLTLMSSMASKLGLKAINKVKVAIEELKPIPPVPPVSIVEVPALIPSLRITGQIPMDPNYFYQMRI
jgi:hypothetical protein